MLRGNAGRTLSWRCPRDRRSRTVSRWARRQAADRDPLRPPVNIRAVRLNWPLLETAVKGSYGALARAQASTASGSDCPESGRRMEALATVVIEQRRALRLPEGCLR